MNTVSPVSPAAVGPRRAAALALAALLVTSLASGCGSDGGGNGDAGGKAPGSSQGATESPGGDSGGSEGSTAPGADDSSAAPSAPGSTAPGTKPAAPGGTTAPRKVRVAAYFMHGEKVSPAPRTVTAPATAAGAVRALLAGPNAYERQHDRTTAIPSGTKLNSIALKNGVATVDLSGRFDDGGGSLSMQARLAQVVFTATRFSSVKQVSFELDGKPVKVFGGEGIVLNGPVGRAYFEDLSPVVLVESPMIGETIHSPVRVWGTANTFEATLRLKLKDSAGKTVANPYVTATSGTGTRGTYDVTVPYKTTHPGAGLLIAYYDSPEDGRPAGVDTIPLNVGR
ncbi:GerMN domain-containing protein [Streptomyces sp. GC420]|uniref:GerMN domain-containing protein n=1 Tax=Streptomyces sp. GC420 TaxID=2697568 RepID=UPI001414EB94|nr:Gmad2 immunoglobulin-like domain-containing protein [Streptomyces sp. GC420]NBM17012.1 spore gernimation protein [Streptomyces sp. GC420]